MALSNYRFNNYENNENNEIAREKIVISKIFVN